jgi:hypothetical protein
MVSRDLWRVIFFHRELKRKQPTLEPHLKNAVRRYGRRGREKCGLARKIHAKSEATSSLRARKRLNRHFASAQAKDLQKLKSAKVIPIWKKAAEFSGIAGEFSCHSLYRSQISKHL